LRGGVLSLSRMSTKLPRDHHDVRLESLLGSIKFSPERPDKGTNVMSLSLKLTLIR
jgi:hypothetical protein